MVTKLKIAIASQDLPQWKVAQKAGMHDTLLSMFVTGRRVPGKDHIKALAKVLNVAQKDLVEG